MIRRSQVHQDSRFASDQITPTQSLENLYERHLTAIYRFIYSKVGNREEAEDLTSQVFTKALRSLDSARDAESIQGWLFQVARTTIADHWREFYRLRTDSLEVLIEAGWEARAADEDVPSATSADRAQRILYQLPARYREVLTYRFLMNYSIRETAEKLGLTEANVKVLQYRALQKAAEIGIHSSQTSTDG